MASTLPSLTPEQRRAAAGQFERANQVLASGNYDYGIQLLFNCCLIDPASPIYRQTLRQAEKKKFQNNLKGSALAFLTNLRAKLQLKTSLRTGNYVKVLERAERVFLRNPWDVPASLAMSEAFTQLELPGMAIWTLDQARQVEPANPRINRPLARLCEKSGNFNAAIALWELVRKADPKDQEAQSKHKDLAASATIAKGRYERAIHGQAPTPLQGAAAATATEQAAGQAAGLSEPPQAGDLPQSVDPTDEKMPREVAALQAKIQAQPTNPNHYLHLASVYRRADLFDKAALVLRDGLGPTGNHFDLMMEVVDLEIEPLRRDLVLTDELLFKDAGNDELKELHAKLAKEIATRELDYFRRKADRHPTDANLRFEVGVRLLRTGQIDESIRELQAVRNDPRLQGKALVYLGFCFQSRNNWRLAQRNFEEALRHLGVGDESLRKDVIYQLAKGYADAGEYQRALDLACELANLDYSYKDIGRLLDEWTSILQKA
ncbi:MAG: tetratricopeptide repeat protein [Gemmataceae bacterium]|nr:tetratricopeptide repeat protein [Gemmataceae bacterium]MCI0739547.1 tetratricopeptide repeat protein [Gemmataceae bacterium]